MKIFIVCSKKFYDRVAPIRSELQALGHEIILPNSFDDPTAEERVKSIGNIEHSKWKRQMFEESRKKLDLVDSILVINLEKHGVENYIGGATFLEMYDAYMLGKKIFLYNDIPEGILCDEINGFDPVVIHSDLSRIV